MRLLVCGEPPGHEPPRRDAAWPVEWRAGDAEATVTGPYGYNCRFEYCTAPPGECENPE